MTSFLVSVDPADRLSGDVEGDDDIAVPVLLAIACDGDVESKDVDDDSTVGEIEVAVDTM